MNDSCPNAHSPNLAPAASGVAPQVREWWPLFVGAFLGASLNQFLQGWLPPPAAAGIAFLLGWLVAGLIFLVRPPHAEWRFMRWIAGGVLGSVIAATLTLVF